ncbi:ribosome small subunit-dependent GTPase A [Terrilactibacillus laevilacticus]|uniref:Small ribosomal subunit biogenesis GTPase RsgA n=1 Tax=Terrilactibacillus laevilacticus TaxID=1380157 RepID=A0ABW5PMP6_9BACI
MTYHLSDFGWNEALQTENQSSIAEGQTIARVISEYKQQYKVLTENGELFAEITGKMRHEALSREDFPAVGDWVVVEERLQEQKATIHTILPRFSKFSRKAAGNRTDEQIVATNMNTVFLVMALNRDFNLRRLERYLMMAYESGANPVIILSKSDLCEDIDNKVSDVESIAFGVPIYPVSAKENTGMNELKNYLGKGQTIVFLGSSGAGKSTLTNWLCGEEIQKVSYIREDDDRGRHTTTHRELIVLQSGGAIIDTPGMRELQLWDASDESVSHSFSDIEELTTQCRFRNCTHQNEPGCSVKEALEEGKLEQSRFNSYLKLQRELAFLERKMDKQAQLKEKNKWKKIAGDRTRKHRH